MLCRAALVGVAALMLLVACQSGIPTRHPSDWNGYWDTTVAIRDEMTWDEWCTALGAFYTLNNALRYPRDSAQQRWKDAARAGGMTRQQYLESQAYCGEPWRTGAAAPSFTSTPVLHIEKPLVSGLLPPYALGDEVPTHDEKLALWGAGYECFREGHRDFAFTTSEISNAWIRASRLLGFNRDRWNESAANIYKIYESGIQCSGVNLRW